MGAATREAYGQALVELIENEDVVVLDADLAHATKTIEFKKKCPERFFDMGIAEQDMVATAAGFAASGKIPFVSSFAIFAAGRAFEQIRNSVCYPKLNVKIAATHAGITVGEDGGTHQAVEDISLMRSIPNMVVLNPADDIEAKAAIFAAVEYYGPVYIRLGRAATPTIHDSNHKFNIGKGEVLTEGNDVAIIATGIMVAKALEAEEILRNEGIKATVVNISTIKPIDKELIINVAKKSGKVVIAEEHSIIGGLNSAICEVLSHEYPVKVKSVGINDLFGKSGTSAELLEGYGLTADNIVRVTKEFFR